ncbi:MAG: bifunctional UDP-N-acetylmuramoyl-tripeptide:D-alanyl-D-alanine ligase/alanine racemase [Bacteroidales bacterium]|nr:bifunctional UDP-N-acetylmuramoyl-tripeptide:D-alanyl-D-alanine ligase/alanine racemase [Bacteroidales bacterium]
MIKQETISEIAQRIGGVLLQQPHPDAVIRELAFDSRRVQQGGDTLFFALVTQRNDGHRYIGELYRKGMRHFVVDTRFSEAENYPEADFIQTEDTLKALQDLAKAHRKQFHVPIIGITGSNGKTTVKEWLYQLLCEDYHISYTPNSFNSQIGVPVSVWSLNEDTQLGIFEAGISRPDEMNALKAIIEPTIGILTNVGSAHSEHFMGMRQKIGEKLNFFRNVETLILSLDNGEVNEVLLCSGLAQKIKLFTWSRNRKEADLYIQEVEIRDKQTRITAVYKEDTYSIRIPFIDEGAIENTLHCWACMLLLGYSNDLIAERVARLKPVAMRLEMKQGIRRCLIINDTYNSDLNSLQIAVDLMANQGQYGKRTIILSDLLQSGRSERELYQEISKLLVQKGVSRIIGIGDAISRQAACFPMEKVFYKTTSDFLSTFDTSKLDNEVILVKGARKFEFERISAFLELKTHETVMEVNLNNLISNLDYFRSRLQPETKVMAMVKAYSYGTGDIDIANELQYHKVDYLTVAYADEGITLRNKNISLPILVMNSDERSVALIVKHRLQPEIYNFRILQLYEDALKRQPQEEPLHVHIKIDTGMHRLGFQPEDMEELLRRLRDNSQLRVESVFSHFAAADDPMEDAFTHGQASLLTACHDVITEALGYRPLKHIANSTGILRFPEYQYDMVRLGLGLYGVNPFADPFKIQCVATLRTIVSQLKRVPAGDTVGYNRRWKAERDSVIATIPIGYADGFPRSLSNGKGELLVNGQLVHTVGMVCMDMTMLDVTDIAVKEGDVVTVFGPQISITQMAHRAECTEYELLTGISQRVNRIFVRK